MHIFSPSLSLFIFFHQFRLLFYQFGVCVCFILTLLLVIHISATIVCSVLLLICRVFASIYIYNVHGHQFVYRVIKLVLKLMSTVTRTIDANVEYGKLSFQIHFKLSTKKGGIQVNVCGIMLMFGWLQVEQSAIKIPHEEIQSEGERE